jgi:hypothetical protein
MLDRPTFAALILAATVSGASSLEAMLGDAFVALPPPAGFCQLTPQYEFDGRIAAIAAGHLASAGIRLLAIYADCDQLAEAREGRRRRQVDDLVEYQVERLDEKRPAVFSIERMCYILRLDGRSPIGSDVNAHLASAIERIRQNESGSIGVIAEDKNACYTAMLHKTWTETGTVKILVGLHAATIVRNRAIGVRRHTVYQNSDTVDAALAKLKSDVAALIAANP